jgi:hypothetical protein
MKVRFYNIEWDTDGENVDLPNEVTLDVDNDLDVANEGADALSDKYDFCVHCFKFDIPRRTIKVQVEVKAPEGIDDAEIARLIDRLLDVGYEESQRSLEVADDFEDNDPRLIANLEIADCEVAK